jgi:hypothetical protein
MAGHSSRCGLFHQRDTLATDVGLSEIGASLNIIKDTLEPLVKSTAMEALLYIGAGGDAYPITCPELRRRFSLIIYTDPAPTASGTLLQLCNEGGQYAGLSKPGAFTLESDGAYSALLKDGCELRYYMNCDLVARVPPSVLARVTTIYLARNAPAAILESLPNVRMCYAMRIVDGTLYWEFFSRFAGGNMPGTMARLSEWISTSSMDVWEWIGPVDGFRRTFEHGADKDWNGFWTLEGARPHPPLFESDAPTSWVLLQRDESSDDDDDETSPPRTP